MDPSTLTAPSTTVSSAFPSPGALPSAGGGAEWHSVRHAPDAHDCALHDRTFKWIATLPLDLRPMVTGRQYPRIVNRIGDLWPHCEYTRLYFQSLLIDRRKGRRGFPLAVRKELEALQQYYFEHLSGLPAILWNAVPLNPPKIPHMVFPRRPETSEIDIPALY